MKAPKNFEESYFELTMKCDQQAKILKLKEEEIRKLTTSIEQLKNDNKQLISIIKEKQNSESDLQKKISNLMEENKTFKMRCKKYNETENLQIKKLHEEIFVCLSFILEI